ncbi:MAG: hypothetical protein QM790_01270 [Nibricoccus sp.]
MSDPFQPTWLRALIVVAIAAGSYFIPQKIPLEYYPLNNPSSGLQYLEITCAANTTGETQIYLNFGRGFNELDMIRLPIGPSDMAFTYTFPLLDAPLLDLRLDPFANGPGEFTITNFRMINRREEELCRFTQESLFKFHNIEPAVPLEKGWKLVMKPGATDPSVYVRLPHPMIPEGMNERNLKRCLLSTSYLAGMLWLILLAIYFALRLFSDWKSCARACAFLLFIAACFSVVGNRGLIENSRYYARKAKRIEAQASQNQKALTPVPDKNGAH